MRWILIALITTACAGVGRGTYQVPTGGDVASSPATVLAEARQWCADNGFVVTGSSESHITATSDLRSVEGRTTDTWSGIEHQRLAFDCGGPPAGGRGYVTEAVLSVTAEAGAMTGTTRVRVTMQPRAATWGLQGCVSTGLVEGELLEALGATPRR